MTDNKKSFWGNGVAILYGGFVLFILSLVGFASFQHFDLVANDYYKRGIAYQTEIDKTKRSDSLAVRPQIAFSTATGTINIVFPETPAGKGVTGSLMLYRPSDSHLDRTISLKLDSLGNQSVPLGRVVPGKWVAKLDWTVDGQQYYNEQMIFVE
jgi:hypothetical protein